MAPKGIHVDPNPDQENGIICKSGFVTCPCPVKSPEFLKTVVIKGSKTETIGVCRKEGCRLYDASLHNMKERAN